MMALGKAEVEGPIILEDIPLLASIDCNSNYCRISKLFLEPIVFVLKEKNEVIQQCIEAAEGELLAIRIYSNNAAFFKIQAL